MMAPKAAKLVILTKSKRKRGQRAKLTMANILGMAVFLLGEGGVERFSLRRLAKAMFVQPRSIQGRFKGGLTSFWLSLAQFALRDLAKPPTPSDTADSYIRDLFRAALKSFRGRPALAGIVAREMARNYAIAPRLTERVLVALYAGGLAAPERIAALDVVFGVLAGLLLIETGTETTEKAHAQAITAQVSALPTIEFPELTKRATGLADRIAKRPGQGETIADRYAELVILSLKLATPKKRAKPLPKEVAVASE
jgi:hypothetical protein